MTQILSFKHCDLSILTKDKVCEIFETEANPIFILDTNIDAIYNPELLGFVLSAIYELKKGSLIVTEPENAPKMLFQNKRFDNIKI